MDHSGVKDSAVLEWLYQEMNLLQVHDRHRVTEDGAEAVALVYANVKAGWVVKRRLQRLEKADWLLENQGHWLALEVSGTADGDPFTRLKEKRSQIAQCSLSAERLAIVIAFDRPSIVAESL